jgi:hypothetical protein
MVANSKEELRRFHVPEALASHQARAIMHDLRPVNK